ncbi:MAG: NAD(P)-binding protein [archaeon]
MAVNILGAGVSGLCAAIRLAQNGENAVVHERNADVGMQMQENTQALRNYEGEKDLLEQFKEWGLKLGHFKEIHRITKYAPSGRNITTHSDGKRPIFQVIKRGPHEHSLDRQLFYQAQDEGVKFDFNSSAKVRDCEIIATGPLFKNGIVHGVELNGVNLDQDRIHFFMNNDFAPGGYIYIIPYGTDLSISSVIVNVEANVKGMLFNFIAKHELIADMLEGAEFGNEFEGYAYYNIPETAVVKGHLFTGGAAGFVEAARGFGVIYAIKSGLHAADSILNHADYDALWKADFGKELMDGFKRRAMMSQMTNADYEKMVKGGEKLEAEKYKKMRAEEIEAMKVKFMHVLEKWRKTHDISQFVD